MATHMDLYADVRVSGGSKGDLRKHIFAFVAVLQHCYSTHFNLYDCNDLVQTVVINRPPSVSNKKFAPTVTPPTQINLVSWHRGQIKRPPLGNSNVTA